MAVEKLGQKIKELRNAKNWSQEDLAKASDVPFTTIAKIETSVIKNPSIAKVAKIATALGVTVDELISANLNE